MAVGDPSVITHTNPVVIPPKRSPRRTPVNLDTRNRGRDARRESPPIRRPSSAKTPPRNVPTSVATLLEVTAIPPRKSSTIRNSRKPPGNHVEDFSRLLMEGIEPRDSPALDSSGNSPLDFLLGPLDDEKSILASELESEAPLSVRSMSPDSVPSLDHELGSFTPSSPATPTTPSPRRLSDRRKQLSPPVDCASDHPLLETEEPDSFESFFTPSKSVVSSKPSSPSRTFPRLGSTFKSNLTASLRALKSAAQMVSNFATPSVQPEDFLTRSLFSITPELTDDRRPLPMSGTPSPALRRYLNPPITLSPAEMHVYHESPLDPRSCPVSIQMQTYHRSGSAGGRRRSRFCTGAASGRDQQLCLFDPEIPTSRQREPRENSDFLRVVVLEMNMRRSGKLRDDIPSRAKVWLPPRKPARLVSSAYGDEEETAIPQRWIGISIECA
ncbi:hypothetical protein VTN77DRAFT_2304 [Rasamsonia byssochlamydoides]|uniref:uncharacterized protein n=1 Tax=Rasamsonia byssochlamydoides TaxID=89139 RepID=UPI00374350F0